MSSQASPRTSNTSTIPVLIVGAGPTGLALALTLAKNNIPFRIIEKSLSFHTAQRGAGIQPRTLDIFNYLDVLPDILAKGRDLPLSRFYKLPGGVVPEKTFHMMPPADPTPSIPYNNAVMLAQSSTQAILRAHLEKHGHYVEVGTEFCSLEQHDDKVTANLAKNIAGEKLLESVDCRWLVATDGGRSAVRKQLSLTFQGDPIGQPTVIGEIEVKSGLDQIHWHNWAPPGGVRVGLRPTENDGVFAFLVGGAVELAPLVSDRASLLQAFKKGSDRDDIVFGDIINVAEWRPQVRMVDTFQSNRVFLAGDAAHVHTPAGGQGLNSSIQDAFNLAWKLALVEKGLSDPSLLSTYSEERIPVIIDMLKMTSELFRHVAIANKDEAGLSQAILALRTREDHVKQFGVNYRWSSIVLDERSPVDEGEDLRANAYGSQKSDVLRAGDRAPDAPDLVDGEGKTYTLLRVFGPTHHTVVIFSTSEEVLESYLSLLRAYLKGIVRTLVVSPQGSSGRSKVDGVDTIVVDDGGHAYATYGASDKEAIAVAVRPDGVVGAIVHGAEGLRRYFEKIFL